MAHIVEIVRFNPKVLNRFDYHGLGCRSVRSLLFLPLIMKLQKEFGYLHEDTTYFALNGLVRPLSWSQGTK